MKDNFSLNVTCPYCGRTTRVVKEITRDYLNDWDRILSDFDTEEFHCSCGESFLGAETKQSEKIGRLLEVASNLRDEGKFSITENGVKIKLGFSDIWKLIRELKDLKDVVGDQHER
jgi:hypothetical protein